MLTRQRVAIALTTLGSFSLFACGGGGPTSAGYQNPPPAGQPPAGQPPPSTSSTITVRNNRFEPAAATVNVGTTVTWTWDACTDDGYGGRQCIDHNVTFDAGGPNSPTQSTGVFTRQFSTAGTFNYHCTLHGTSMSGQVVVR